MKITQFKTTSGTQHCVVASVSGSYYGRFTQESGLQGNFYVMESGLNTPVVGREQEVCLLTNKGGVKGFFRATTTKVVSVKETTTPEGLATSMVVAFALAFDAKMDKTKAQQPGETTDRELFFRACETADWYYEYSDDAGVWRRGRKEIEALKEQAKDPAFAEIYAAWTAYIAAYARNGRRPVWSDHVMVSAS